MIAVKDLAIGNWVYDGESTQFPMFVQTIADDYVYLNFKENEGDVWESTPEELHGIPLTAELLEKIGFQFNGTGLWKITKKRLSISINIEREFIFIETFGQKWRDNRAWWNDVKFLHQLQNCYRIVARDDLEINL